MVRGGEAAENALVVERRNLVALLTGYQSITAVFQTSTAVGVGSCRFVKLSMRNVQSPVLAGD